METFFLDHRVDYKWVKLAVLGFSFSWIHHIFPCSSSFHCIHSSIAQHSCKNVSLRVSPVLLESGLPQPNPCGHFLTSLLGCTSNDSSLKCLSSAFSSKSPCRLSFPFARASDNLENSAMHPFISRKSFSYLFSRKLCFHSVSLHVAYICAHPGFTYT